MKLNNYLRIFIKLTHQYQKKQIVNPKLDKSQLLKLSRIGIQQYICMVKMTAQNIYQAHGKDIKYSLYCNQDLT